MRLGVAGPGPHLFFETFFCHGFARISADKTFHSECVELSVKALFSRGFHSILPGLHSFSTNHFAFRFVFAYPSREIRPECCAER